MVMLCAEPVVTSYAGVEVADLATSREVMTVSPRKAASRSTGWPTRRSPRARPVAVTPEKSDRLYQFWRAAVWSAALVVIGLVLGAAAWKPLLLLIPGFAMMFCLMCIGLMHDTKASGWDMLYQLQRVERGLPARQWWDGRLA